MKLVLNGTATSQYSEKSIEINGKPMQHILGVLSTNEGPLPITVWGDTKGNYWKQFAECGEPFSIVAELQAKPQTFTNHEGETVTVPNLQIKLYSFLNTPTNVVQCYRNAPVSTPPPQPHYSPDPTGCFVSSTPEQKAEELRPISEKVRPWNVASTPGLEAIL